MYINKECELHDMLGLHDTKNGKCSCGVVVINGVKALPDDISLAMMLVGENALRHFATGTCDDRDVVALKRLGVNASEPSEGYCLSDSRIERMAEQAQAQFLPVAIELYKKTEFPVSEAVLRDAECRKLAWDRWIGQGWMRIQAKAPISLGWNFLAETDTNITNGNKARIYERDGVIAVQHAKRLQKLEDWRMRCKQLYKLAIAVCGKDAVVEQTAMRNQRWLAKLK